MWNFAFTLKALFIVSQDGQLTGQDRNINKLKDSYLHWSKNQLKELAGSLDRLNKGTTKRPNSLWNEIYNTSNNIKGLGGSFGYFLMTDIATSLCKYLRNIESSSDIHPQIIEAHIDAMEQVICHGIEGLGGEAGLLLMESLKQSIEKLKP